MSALALMMTPTLTITARTMALARHVGSGRQQRVMSLQEDVLLQDRRRHVFSSSSYRNLGGISLKQVHINIFGNPAAATYDSWKNYKMY